jgi:rhodanese-related sulfurtransferase
MQNRFYLYDVRQPLDFLAYPQIIPGAMRIAPKDIAEHTASFSRDQNSVIYCTGTDDDTSNMILGKARALNFPQVRLLKGGLEGWKAKGYPVEEYLEPFQLDTVIQTSYSAFEEFRFGKYGIFRGLTTRSTNTGL